LALSPALYRVVTTMPPEVFAVIRAHTDGRSAIQSRGFRRIEAVCAPRPDIAAGVPLQEALLRATERLGGVATARLCAELVRLDEAWCAMKRTHWGITVKIIGTVPGTGGTTGADYLRRAAAVPLFPALAARPLQVPA
jgi:tryptophan 2,3-dioxygenase